MRCARCLRDIASVEQRDDACPAYLCEDCYEYEKTWQAFKAESMSKDRGCLRNPTSSAEVLRIYSESLWTEIASTKIADAFVPLHANTTVVCGILVIV